MKFLGSLQALSMVLSCFIFQIADGDRLPLAVKELGSCDLYPQVYLLLIEWTHTSIVISFIRSLVDAWKLILIFFPMLKQRRHGNASYRHCNTSCCGNTSFHHASKIFMLWNYTSKYMFILPMCIFTYMKIMLPALVLV